MKIIKVIASIFLAPFFAAFVGLALFFAIIYYCYRDNLWPWEVLKGLNG